MYSLCQIKETPHSAGHLIRTYTERLKRAKVYAPFQDAQILLAHAINIEFTHEFPLPWETIVDKKAKEKADTYIQRREKREPLTRILGYSYFWGLKFEMADKVFRPDPHAEALIDNALMILEEKKDKPLRILDLGTGSGCLLLSLLHSLPQTTGVGVDIDKRSILAAQKNAKNLNLENRAVFFQSSWGENIKEQFDFIISNPPAVTTDHMPLLDPEMKDYETIQSLAGGDDGLDSLKSIVTDLDRLLKSDGIALFRAHTWEREAHFFKKAGYKHVEVRGNYRQNPWCVIIKNKKRKTLLRFVEKIISPLFGNS
jgi:release factor glutamine methyltransferase